MELIKLDALIEKVQLILDMGKPIKINLRISRGKTALHRAYFNIYKKRKELRAWYMYRIQHHLCLCSGFDRRNARPVC
jgi:hypothetical protein